MGARLFFKPESGLIKQDTHLHLLKGCCIIIDHFEPRGVMKTTAAIQRMTSIAIPEPFQVVLGSIFIAICAQVSVPLPFTPVPLTGQTFGVMLMGALLGSRIGTHATILYLLQGAFGLPVWAGGASGFYRFFGPTGGYLLAYPLQAFLLGYFLEKKQKLLAIFFTSTVQLTIGSLWLGFFLGFQNGFAKGFCPFICVEILKATLTTIFYRKIRHAN
jgi:biotin transport system substrate-specific component